MRQRATAVNERDYGYAIHIGGPQRYEKLLRTEDHYGVRPLQSFSIRGQTNEINPTPNLHRPSSVSNTLSARVRSTCTLSIVVGLRDVLGIEAVSESTNRVDELEMVGNSFELFAQS